MLAAYPMDAEAARRDRHHPDAPHRVRTLPTTVVARLSAAEPPHRPRPTAANRAYAAARSNTSLRPRRILLLTRPIDWVAGEAAALGVDLPTYNMLMDLQHRDITPEDYETLRHLDSNVKPKTLSRSRLEARAPCWHVSSEPIPSSAYRLVDQKCSICLEYFKVGERARRLPCNHVLQLKSNRRPRGDQHTSSALRCRCP